MKLWKIVIVLFVFASSCSIQQKPKLQVTHVIAVTHEGDTLKLPIDVIRPINNYRIINYSGYSGWGYNYGWHNPYYNYHRNYDYSYGSSGRSSNNGNTDKGINKIVPREDPGDKRPSGDVLLKGKN